MGGMAKGERADNGPTNCWTYAQQPQVKDWSL